MHKAIFRAISASTRLMSSIDKSAHVLNVFASIESAVLQDTAIALRSPLLRSSLHHKALFRGPLKGLIRPFKKAIQRAIQGQDLHDLVRVWLPKGNFSQENMLVDHRRKKNSTRANGVSACCTLLCSGGNPDVRPPCLPLP